MKRKLKILGGWIPEETANLPPTHPTGGSAILRPSKLQKMQITLPAPTVIVLRGGGLIML